MEQYERNSWPWPHNMLALKCCIEEQGERNQYAHKVHNAHTHMCVHVTKVYNTKGTPPCSHRVCKMHTIHAKVRQERLVCAHSAHSVHIICAICAHSAQNVFKSKGRTPTKHKPVWGIGAGDRILALTKGFHALCLYVCNMLLPFKVLAEVL